LPSQVPKDRFLLGAKRKLAQLMRDCNAGPLARVFCFPAPQCLSEPQKRPTAFERPSNPVLEGHPTKAASVAAWSCEDLAAILLHQAEIHQHHDGLFGCRQHGSERHVVRQFFPSPR